MTAEGISIRGSGPISGKRREQRMARLVNQVFAMREQGMGKVAIAKELHIAALTVDRILHDPDNVRRRLSSYNEQLRAATPVALKVVYEVLTSTAPQALGQRAEMARWVLEMGKTVGKESPVNVFIKGGDTHINLSNDTLEAARAVAEMMRGAGAKALPENVIEAVVIEQKEENSNEYTGVNVGVAPRSNEDERRDGTIGGGNSDPSAT